MNKSVLLLLPWFSGTSSHDKVLKANKMQFSISKIALCCLGLAVGVLRRSAVIGNSYFRRRFMISLQITNEDA